MLEVKYILVGWYVLKPPPQSGGERLTTPFIGCAKKKKIKLTTKGFQKGETSVTRGGEDDEVEPGYCTN